MKQYVIGLDIGTTCTKCVLIDQTGKIAGQGSRGYTLYTDGDKVEQSAQDWIHAATVAIREAIQGIDASYVKGISCSTQGGSTVAVREDGTFIGNAWTWMDKRSTQQVREVDAQIGAEEVYRITGSRTSAALDAAKIRKMKTLPEYKDASKYLTTLEVINGWLTGNAVIDPSNAAMRQLFHIDTCTWDKQLMQAACVDIAELPAIMPAGAFVGGLSYSASEATGLPVGTPVFNGAHDQYCASIGSGVIQAGEMLLSAGTTWVLLGITDTPMYTPSYIGPGRHPIDGLYGALVSLVGSGTSMQWFHNNFMHVSFDVMNQEVTARRDKTKGLFFFPYMTGAPYPIRNPDAKGAFFGLTLEHDAIDLARAVMEGVAFSVRRALDDFASYGADIKTITMMGGASKSEPWIQMIASAANVNIRRLNTSDVCALGAAAIAACGVGFFSNYQEAANAMVSLDRVFEPDPEDQKWYHDKFAEYDRLWKLFEKYYKGES